MVRAGVSKFKDQRLKFIAEDCVEDSKLSVLRF
jgi:hypothetical protein